MKFTEMNSLNASKDSKDILKIDEELEKEKVIIGSPIKKNNFTSNPKDFDLNLNNILSNDSFEKLNIDSKNVEKPNLINSMKNKNYDFINFSIEHINKSKNLIYLN